jgi:hypothetical protein
MPPLHTHFIDRLALLTGFLSGFALYPYIYQVLFQGVDNNLSTVTLLLILCNNVVWIAYSLHRILVSLFIASSLSLVAAFTLLII